MDQLSIDQMFLIAGENGNNTGFSIASNEKSEEIQCVIFFHMISEDALHVYDIAHEEVNKIVPLLQKFENYFSPKKKCHLLTLYKYPW